MDLKICDKLTESSGPMKNNQWFSLTDNQWSSLLDLTVGLMLFNVLLSVLDNYLKCTLSRFADNIKLGIVISILEGRAAIQEDINRLEKWAVRKLLQFNKGKHKSCPWDELTQHRRTAGLMLAHQERRWQFW